MQRKVTRLVFFTLIASSSAVRCSHSEDPVFLCTELCTATERRPLPAGIPHWKEGRWVGAEQTGGHEKEQQCLQLLLVATIRKTIYLKSEVQFFCSDPGIYSRNNMSIIWLDNKKNHRLQSALSELHWVQTSGAAWKTLTLHRKQQEKDASNCRKHFLSDLVSHFHAWRAVLCKQWNNNNYSSSLLGSGGAHALLGGVSSFSFSSLPTWSCSEQVLRIISRNHFMISGKRNCCWVFHMHFNAALITTRQAHLSYIWGKRRTCQLLNP